MNKLKEETQILIEVFCLVIIIFLCVAVYFNGRNLSCDKCYLTFKQTKSFGKTLNPAIEFQVKALDLYNNFTKEKICIVEWIKDSGFTDKSKKIMEYSNASS